MGIFCKICVVNPPNNVFIPGNFVTGTIDYSFDSNTVVKRIQLSLKGSGYLETSEHRDGKESTTTTTEKYVDIQTSVLNEYGKEQFVNQHYKTPFNFRLPENIPGSLKYLKEIGIKCEIMYNIEIEFEVEGFLKFNKIFKKEIKVVPVSTPRLSMEPIIYGKKKDLFQLFKSDNSIMIKACITNSVLEPGDKVQVSYELVNDSKKTIKAVESKLVALYKFYNGSKVEDVISADCKSVAIEKGVTKESQIEIDIPSDLYHIENSKLVSREYGVIILVHLPMPHINMKLLIPIQIGKMSVNLENDEINKSDPASPPPSYWEVMEECDGMNIL